MDSSSLSTDDPVSSGAEQGKTLDSATSGPPPNVKLYVVVACIAALVLVAIIQASCTIFKMSKRGSSVHKVAQTFHTYSITNFRVVYI